MWANEFAENIWKERYRLNNETWEQTAKRVANVVQGVLSDKEIVDIQEAIYYREIVPAGRYFKNAGTQFKQFSNCLALSVGDSKEEWGKLADRTFVALMCGTGVGINFSKVRPYGSSIRNSEDFASGPVSLMQAINGIAETVRSGGVRRSALMFCLNWQHKDIFTFISAKEQDGKLAMANISVVLDDEFFNAFDNPQHSQHERATNIFDTALDGMYKNGEPGFLVNTGHNAKDVLVNPCGEFRTDKSGEVCNLGSVNLARCLDLDDLYNHTILMTKFLIAAREVADKPFEDAVFDRVGVGLLGKHEWLLHRRYTYGFCDELNDWFEIWSQATLDAAFEMQSKGFTLPSALRCIAPTGTIGAMSSTTSGGDPIPFSAYIRSWYNKQNELVHTPVIDPVALQYNTDECALNISLENQLEALSQLQFYTDMAISHTINLPYENDTPGFYDRQVIRTYLPKLRGLTMYRNGSRDGQPIVPTTISNALKLQRGTNKIECKCRPLSTCVDGVCGE